MLCRPAPSGCNELLVELQFDISVISFKVQNKLFIQRQDGNAQTNKNTVGMFLDSTEKATLDIVIRTESR